MTLLGALRQVLSIFDLDLWLWGYWWYETFIVILTPLTINVTNMNTQGTKYEKMSSLGALRQILSILDLDLWLQGHNQCSKTFCIFIYTP